MSEIQKILVVLEDAGYCVQRIEKQTVSAKNIDISGDKCGFFPTETGAINLTIIPASMKKE